MKVYNPTQSIKDTQMIHDAAYVKNEHETDLKN